jgi:hypothetical protein
MIVVATIPSSYCHKVHGQTNPNRRPEGMNYAIISSCDIIFLDTNPNDTQAYPFTFFICLSMEDIEVLNSTAQPVQLNTFHGPNNWATNPDQAVIDAMWDNLKSLEKTFRLTLPGIDNAKHRRSDRILCLQALPQRHYSSCHWATCSHLPANMPKLCCRLTNKPTIHSLPNKLTTSNGDSKTFATIQSDTYAHISTIKACFAENLHHNPRTYRSTG